MNARLGRPARSLGGGEMSSCQLMSGEKLNKEKQGA